MLFTPPVLADHLNQALTKNGQTPLARPALFGPAIEDINNVSLGKLQKDLLATYR
jgi:hypothetical protein